jgi:hypothetical protein
MKVSTDLKAGHAIVQRNVQIATNGHVTGNGGGGAVGRFHGWFGGFHGWFFKIRI